jgi:putative protease
MRSLSAQKGVVRKNQPRIIWRLPPVIEEAELHWFREQIRKLVGDGFHRFELGHVTQYELFPLVSKRERESEGARSSSLELFGHYSLNIFNSAALQMVNEIGLRGAVFSLETESGNMKAALADFAGNRKKHRGNFSTGLFVYGRPPLFTARLASTHYDRLKQVESPKQEKFSIDQKDGLTKVSSILPFSLLHLQNEIIESGIDYMVFDLSGGPAKQEIAIVNSLFNNPGKLRQQVLSGNYHGIMV